MKNLYRAAAIAGIGIALATGNQPVRSCDEETPDNVSVRVADEQAVIVWDAKRHLEHFIRQANFVTDAANFAFIVPSPATPQLAQADTAVFDDLTPLLTPPQRFTRLHGIHLTSLLWQPAGEDNATDRNAATKDSAEAGAGREAASGSVTIVGKQTVAGLDATTLRADNAAALGNWLKGHGYPVSVKLQTWIAPYVAKHWTVTAFRIAKAQGAPQVSSALVRMTFHTDKPFYPYREAPSPASVSAGRDLRVFLVSDGRMQGDIGGTRGAGWPGAVQFAGDLPAGKLASQVALTSADLPAKPWLTVFDDTSSPRPGKDDVWFTPSTDRSAVSPPPVETIVDDRMPIPVELLAFLLGLTGIGFWWMRRRRLGKV